MTPNSDDDPYLRALVGIGAELTAIRRELQSFNAGRETAAEAFECRCGAVIDGERNAEQHARAEHNAPADHWQECYE